MQVTGITEESAKGVNMAKMLGLTLLLSFFVAFAMHLVVIHQIHAIALLSNQADSKDPNSESMTMLKRFN